jgi:serine protease
VSLNFGRSADGGDEEVTALDMLYTHGDQLYAEGEIIVKFWDDADPDDIEAFLNEMQGQAVPTHVPVDFTLVALPRDMDVQKAVTAYAGHRELVEYAEPNFYRYLAYEPNDPLFPRQWHFTQIDLENAWDTQRGGSSDVIVAIIDSGIRRSLPDLQGTRFAPGYDFVDGDTNANDEGNDGFGHGSFVAGVVAQTTNNNFGVAGVAFNSRLMPLRIFPRNGGARVSDAIQAVNFAARNGADIINMSYGANTPSNAERQALQSAYRTGVSLFASAGNSGNDDDFSGDVDYPARYDMVLAVGATDLAEDLAYYSSYGPHLDIVAPGGDTRVDRDNNGDRDGVLQNGFNRTRNGFFLAQGTSFSCPHACGVAALLLGQGVSNDPDAIYTVLTSTARDLGTSGRDRTFGWGLIDAKAALEGLGLDH